MAIDRSVFSGANGSLRLFTLILGAIDLGITAHCYIENSKDERFFFWSVVVLLVVSAILAVVAFVGITNSADLVKKADYIYHAVAGVVLLVAGILMVISVINKGDYQSTATYVERLAAGIIGIINALVYGSLGWTSCRT